jgi:predicted nucleic acid-binding protein
MSFVIDNSVTAGWVLGAQATAYSNIVLEEAKEQLGAVHVPALWEVEFTNLLRTACMRQRLNAQSAQAMVVRLAAMELLVDRTPLDRGALLGLALRHGLTTYDAAYLDLALRLQCPLATQDKGLRDAALACGVGVFKA